MAKTFVMAFTTSDEADAAVGEYSADGYRIVRIGPTDRIELSAEGGGILHWKSGPSADWILVVATRDEVSAGPVPS